MENIIKLYQFDISKNRSHRDVILKNYGFERNKLFVINQNVRILILEYCTTYPKISIRYVAFELGLSKLSVKRIRG